MGLAEAGLCDKQVFWYNFPRLSAIRVGRAAGLVFILTNKEQKRWL